MDKVLKAPCSLPTQCSLHGLRHRLICPLPLLTAVCCLLKCVCLPDELCISGINSPLCDYGSKFCRSLKKIQPLIFFSLPGWGVLNSVLSSRNRLEGPGDEGLSVFVLRASLSVDQRPPEDEPPTHPLSWLLSVSYFVCWRTPCRVDRKQKITRRKRTSTASKKKQPKTIIIGWNLTSKVGLFGYSGGGFEFPDPHQTFPPHFLLPWATKAPPLSFLKGQCHASAWEHRTCWS